MPIERSGNPVAETSKHILIQRRVLIVEANLPVGVIVALIPVPRRINANPLSRWSLFNRLFDRGYWRVDSYSARRCHRIAQT